MFSLAMHDLSSSVYFFFPACCYQSFRHRLLTTSWLFLLSVQFESCCLPELAHCCLGSR
uniref:Uncharacterized protein n=1 Tax=Arundo donax TaxID=35708 RepID=A0A0A9EKI2_ARUDO